MWDAYVSEQDTFKPLNTLHTYCVQNALGLKNQNKKNLPSAHNSGSRLMLKGLNGGIGTEQNQQIKVNILAYVKVNRYISFKRVY